MNCQADLEGLWAWAETHRLDPPDPLTSCYSEGCIRSLPCWSVSGLLFWGEGVMHVASARQLLCPEAQALSPAGAELGQDLP